MSYYDDNYGFWTEMDDPEKRRFYKRVQKESVWKTCSICGRKVKLRPIYDKCNMCTQALESGLDPYE